MKAHLFVLLMSVLLQTGCAQSGLREGEGSVRSKTLPNGIRLVSVHFPESSNVSIFTFSPMGLTSDAADRAQWSHLVEHLVIRSTVPEESSSVNAETMPDHMRLDFYGDLADWKEGLEHHRRWIEGAPFTESMLAAEIPKVNAEADFTARNLATHKFAIAAWSHGRRHGKKHVSLKGDVNAAELDAVQSYRDSHLAVRDNVTVCIVGGLAHEEAFAEAEKQLGNLALSGALPEAANASPRDLDLTWDLEARHLLLTWPIPDFREEDHAALLVAAGMLNMRFFSDPDLKQSIGVALAGADLGTPEGSVFTISASLRPGASFSEVRTLLREHLAELAKAADLAEMAALNLSQSLTEIPPIDFLKSQAPGGIPPAILEANIGLQLGMHEHRYGDFLPALAERIREVSGKRVKQAIQVYLFDEYLLACEIQPPR